MVHAKCRGIPSNLVGVDVNVFNATWEKPRDDVESVAQAHLDANISRQNFLFSLAAGTSQRIPSRVVKEITGTFNGASSSKGRVNMLVEGSKASSAGSVVLRH